MAAPKAPLESACAAQRLAHLGSTDTVLALAGILKQCKFGYLYSVGFFDSLRTLWLGSRYLE